VVVAEPPRAAVRERRRDRMKPFGERGSLLRAAFLACLAAALAFAGWGCGGKSEGGLRESLIEFTLRNLVPVQRQQGLQLVRLQRYPLEDTGGGEESIYERYWKIEGGSFTEIDRQEYDRLREERIEKSQGGWQASEHTIIIRALNQEEGKAALEVGNLYGPLAGEGVVYYLEYRDGGWEVLEKATSWVS